MKEIKIELPAELDTLELHPLADFHIGDGLCDYKMILDKLKYIAETPNAYCTLGGDLMDTAIASSIGDTYAQTHSPMEQLKECVNLFQPIAEKILCILPGNHENRVYKSDGIDITALMAEQLGLRERYSPTTALMFIRFGRIQQHNHGRKACYTVYETHGSGGGRKEGGKINRLADLAMIVDADVYIHNHTHLPATMKKDYFRVDTSNSKVAKVTRLFVNTASALDYGGYGDRQAYSPASKDNPVIILDGHKKQAKAIL